MDAEQLFELASEHLAESGISPDSELDVMQAVDFMVSFAQRMLELQAREAGEWLAEQLM